MTIVCTTADCRDSAVGEAFIDDDPKTAGWHPYCQRCVDDLFRADYQVRKLQPKDSAAQLRDALWRCYTATGADVSGDEGMAASFWADRAVEEVEEIVRLHDATLSVLQDIYDAGLIKDDVLVAQAWAALNYETPRGAAS